MSPTLTYERNARLARRIEPDNRGRRRQLPAPRRICQQRTPHASVFLLALLDDVFADDELAGGASAELLQGQAAHHLLVGGGALGARTRQEAEEPVDQRAHLRLEADDVEQVQEAPGHPRDEAGEGRLPHLHDRLEACDRRHRALVEVGELGGLGGAHRT